MPGVCRYYNTLNGCRFGDRCRYEHVPTTRRSMANGSAPCHFFQSKKGCRFGNTCHFSHEQPSARYGRKSAPSPPATSAGDDEEAGVEPPAAAEAVDTVTVDESVDNSQAVVLYDPKVAQANLLKAVLGVNRKRKPGTELLMATCSQCNKSFSSAATPEDSCLALRDHYVEKLGKVDQKHMKFFNDNDEFSETVFCLICQRSFQQYRGLFRHMRAKMLNKKDPKSAEDHKKIFEEIVRPFVDRDTGYELTEDDITSSVLAFMTEDEDDDDSFSDNDYYSYDDGDDDDDDYDDGAGLLLAMGLVHALRNNHGGLPDYDDDDDDDEYGSGMFGFSDSDCFELMCQGVKPWDDDAGAVMAALNGDYYY